MSIDLIDTIKPKNSADVPMVDDVDFLGGLRVAATTTARDAITLSHQKLGMLCWVTSGGGTLYQLTATGTPGTWSTVSLGGAPSGAAGGDLSGTYPNPGVAKVNGVTISGTPAVGYAIIGTSGTTAIWTAPPTGTGVLHYTAGVPDASASLVDLSTDVTGTLAASKQASQGMFGDVSGTTGASVVLKINGTSVGSAPASSGLVLTSTSTTNATWQAAPSGFTAGGDLTGTSTSQTVAKVNGATVPAAGSLVTGNAPYVSGTSTLTYSALNLAGGSGWVTGALPVANQASQLAGVTSVTGTAAAGYSLRATGSAAAAWTAPPTGVGFPHYTVSGTLDGTTKAVDVSSIDITGVLKVASGGPTYQGTFTTTSSANQTVYTWTMSSASMLRLTADVTVRAPGFSFVGFADVTADYLSDGTTITTVSPSTISNLSTSGLVYTPPLAAFVVSGNTVSFICYGPPSHNYTWIVQIFEVGG